MSLSPRINLSDVILSFKHTTAFILLLLYLECLILWSKEWTNNPNSYIIVNNNKKKNHP